MVYADFMPGRKIPLVTDEVYHVFNRGMNRQPTFTDKREYQRAVESLRFYKVAHPPISLSKYLRLEDQKQQEMSKVLEAYKPLVDIFSYCLMPNHFHFLIRQKEDKGIAVFLSNFQNSYTRYFNTRHDRDGSLFLDQFKAVRIETDEQLLHVSRYIHLNPYTGYLVKTHADLEEYPWSSFPVYLKSKIENDLFVHMSMVLDFFRSNNEYKRFVLDQADYQRKLKEIEHLILE